MTEIVELTAEDLRWPFSGRGDPYVNAPHHTVVDPFPAYPHQLDIVRDALDHMLEVAPIKLAPKALFVLHHEPFERTNGWAQSETDWDEEADEWVPAPAFIVLAGKRIPPHPAVTRYLVAHEYGHHVQYDLQHRRNIQADELRDDYARQRGHDPEVGVRYGGGQWHSNTGELFANDFRILIAGVETDYWPHPDIPRPETVDGLADWWKEALP